MTCLFALGVMSIIWMALITVLISAERLLARPHVSVVVVGCVLAALGVGIAIEPTQIPGLKVPGGRAAMQAMKAMSASGMKP